MSDDGVYLASLFDELTTPTIVVMTLFQIISQQKRNINKLFKMTNVRTKLHNLLLDTNCIMGNN